MAETEPISKSSSFMSRNVIHIAGEILAFTGIVIYFYKRNKTLENQIKELAVRLEEQDEFIKKHEDVLKKIVANIKKTDTPSVKVSQVKKPEAQPVKKKEPTIVFKSQPNLHTLDILDTFNNTTEPGIVELPEETEEDLDNEIQEELSELKSKE
jgi:hypothetical protein